MKPIIEYIKNNIPHNIRIGIMLLLIAFFLLMRKHPSDAMLQQIVSVFTPVGLFVITLNSLFKIITMGKRIFSREFVEYFLRTLVIYSAILWSIGAIGLNIKTIIIENSQGSMIVAISLLLVWLVLNISSSLPLKTNDPNVTFGIPGFAPRLTERDQKFVAAHEAGHALVYAALGSIPNNIQLVVKDIDNADGSLGFITNINSEHRLNEKIFIEWHMLMLLAGKVGESSVFGQNSLGSSQDHSRWLVAAKEYLKNHFDGIFYTEPSNKFEQNANEEKLSNLQSKQVNILTQFFERNSDVLTALYTAAFEKKVIKSAELATFLQQVEIPDDFPLPFGKFESFSTEWKGSK